MGFKLTQEEVLERFKKVHGNKYDYNKVRYKNTSTKVEIICPKENHGSFWIKPNDHIVSKVGCPKCNKFRKKTKNEHIEDFKKVHSNKYDYSKVHFVNTNTKVEIICPEHGSFFQKPNRHKMGAGCPKCGELSKVKKRKLSLNEVIKDFKKVHSNKYNYSNVNYINTETPVNIVCKQCGNSFWQKPSVHKKGSGCPKCANLLNGLNKKQNIKTVLKRLKKNNPKYNYSLITKKDYENSNSKLPIICPEHGIFYKNFNMLMYGSGCPTCGGTKKLTQEEVIKRLNNIYNNTGIKYSLEKVNYVNNSTKIELICPEHGSFWITPNNCFMYGYDCPKCSRTKESSGEKRIREFLESNNITFLQEANLFEKYRFDFYLPDKNILIEYDGIQHFEPVEYFGGEEGLLRTKERDRIKEEFAKNNNIELVRISYKDYSNIENLLNEITINS